MHEAYYACILGSSSGGSFVPVVIMFVYTLKVSKWYPQFLSSGE